MSFWNLSKIQVYLLLVVEIFVTIRILQQLLLYLSYFSYIL